VAYFFWASLYTRHVGLLRGGFCVFDVSNTIAFSAQFVGRYILAIQSTPAFSAPPIKSYSLPRLYRDRSLLTLNSRDRIGRTERLESHWTYSTTCRCRPPLLRPFAFTERRVLDSLHLTSRILPPYAEQSTWRSTITARASRTRRCEAFLQKD